jgi:hypothetical protein
MHRLLPRALGLAFALAAAAASAATDDFVVRWAGTSSQAAGVGAPDGDVYTQGTSASSFTDFGGPIAYAGLAAALGVTVETLALADVIAWEGNGSAPAAGGGWESSVWTFEDSDGGVGSASFAQALSGTFVGNGTLTNADYGALFGMTPATTGLFSFLLIDVDMVAGVNASRLTTIRLAGVAAPGPGLEGTPDPDAVGLLQPVPAPQSWALTAAGLLLLAGCVRARRIR